MAGIEEVPMAETEEELILDQDPFGGRGRGIEIEDGREYNVSQLAEEFSRRTGKDVSVTLTKTKNRRKMWILPKDVDMRKVKGALKAHTPDPDWGLSEEDIANRERVQRLKSGEVLSPEESSAVLRSLIKSKEETGNFVVENE